MAISIAAVSESARMIAMLSRISANFFFRRKAFPSINSFCRYSEPNGANSCAKNKKIRRTMDATDSMRELKATPHNSAARPAMSFPPSAACKFLDLPPVNLRNLHLHLTKNPFASRPPHLCGVTLIKNQSPVAPHSTSSGRFLRRMYAEKRNL